MKPQFAFLLLPLLILLSCNKDDNSEPEPTPIDYTQITIDSFKTVLIGLQEDFREVSNQLDFYNLDPDQHYQSAEMVPKIVEFNTIWEQIKLNEKALANYGHSVPFEKVVCADFEEMACFTGEWSIINPQTGTLRFDTNISYNNSSSLYLSTPDPNESPLVIQVDLEGLEASTAYKLRWWEKFSGTTSWTNDGTHGTHTTVYHGGLERGTFTDSDIFNQMLDREWKMKTVLFSTNSSPAQGTYVRITSRFSNHYIDDVHVVKVD